MTDRARRPPKPRRPRITEAEWLAAVDSIGLDLYYTVADRHRQWRLYGTACSRRAVRLSPDPLFDQSLDVADQFTDGAISWPEVLAARAPLLALRRQLGEPFADAENIYTPSAHRQRLASIEACLAVLVATPLAALGANRVGTHAAGEAARPDFLAGSVAEGREQVRLAHCIFGNPFRPVAFDPRWRTPAAAALADSLYAARDFAALPVLADALEEAGCDAAELLAHLRGPGPHVRGCWALDLVLDRR